MAEPRRPLPEVVGLCPVHLMEFYVPHGGTCPECSEPLAEYVPAEALRRAHYLLDKEHGHDEATWADRERYRAPGGPQEDEGHAPSGAGPGSPQTGR